jgi:hypothetical protein
VLRALAGATPPSRENRLSQAAAFNAIPIKRDHIQAPENHPLPPGLLKTSQKVKLSQKVAKMSPAGPHTH